MQEPPETKELVVRMPEDLHRRVKERADHEERSVAQTIRLALKQYLSTAPTAY